MSIRATPKLCPFPAASRRVYATDWITDFVAGSYVTPLKILGANYAVSLIWSSVTSSFLKGTQTFDTRNPELTSLLNRRLGGSQEGNYTGVSDLVITPVSLG